MNSRYDNNRGRFARDDVYQPTTLVSNMVQSGKNVAKLGLVGFFPACYLGVTAMTVGTAGTILAAGFVGGMAIYFSRNLLANLLSNCFAMDAVRSKLFLQLHDMFSLLLAGAAGATLLGLAVYPVVACIALGLLTVGLVKLCLDYENTVQNIGAFSASYGTLDSALQVPLSDEACVLPTLAMGF